MTVIGSKNEDKVLEKIIESIPKELTYEDLEHLRKSLRNPPQDPLMK